jgi:hypothetical protein
LTFRLKLAVITVAIGLAATPSARAAERVLLANGFDLRCNHHAQVGDVIRLYTNSGDGSYIEMKPGEITGYEIVPDPLPLPSTPRKTNKDSNPTPADLHQMLTAAGELHNLDADLLASVVKAESNGNAHAVSRAGARGLMQLMPKTASEQGISDSFAAEENVRGGSTYLNELLIRYHDNIALALAAYNAGPAAVDRYHGIPPYHETRAYIARVIHEFNRRVMAREAQARLGQTTATLQASPSR